MNASRLSSLGSGIAELSRHLRLGTVVLTGLLAGCQSVGPNRPATTADVPEQWREAADSTFTGNATAGADWWTPLNDPTLDRLISQALDRGLDVREAYARLREARAHRGVAVAERGPTIDASASYWRSGDSERLASGAPGPDADLYSAGLETAWEIDLWGRVRRLVEAADADLAAADADVRDVALALAAETARTYIELRAYQQRLALAHTNVDLQQQTLQLVRARYEAGLVGERDLAQAATNVQVTKSRVPTLETRRREAENRLAVLLGRAPGAVTAELDSAQPIPVPPIRTVVGIPADAVRKRADVRRAEQLWAAEHARIGAATAERYPQLALFGSLGVAAEDSVDLFDHGSGFFGIGPSIRWSLFDGGRLRRRVEVQDARAEQALIQWERTVLVALEESENAMTGFLRGQSHRQALIEAAAQARRAVELAEIEYREGMTDFQAVLDSQRALAQVEDDVAQADASVALQFVALQKALGG